MSPILKVGGVLGALVVAWMFVMGFTGWYKHPMLALAFFLVIPLQIGMLWWGLRQTAQEGRGYGQQVLAGVGMSAIACGMIFVGSLIFTMVLFPSYFADVKAGAEQMMRDAAMSEPQIAEALARYDKQTPMSNALAGVAGTLVTGLVASLVIAIWVRRKA